MSQPGAICSRHNAEARRAENAGRENSSFFFFFYDIRVNFSVKEKTTNYFPWMLAIHFGIDKMASLSEKGRSRQ